MRRLVTKALLLAAVGGAMLGAAPAWAAEYDVRIRRDRFGVPHILGKTDADAAYGLGYAHSEDDFATMVDALLTSRGRLASAKGAAALESDVLFALMDVQGTVDRRYETDLPPDVRKLLGAYAAGVNAYAADHPGQLPAGVAPFTGKDIAMGNVFRSPTFFGLDDVFQDLVKPAKPATAPPATGSNAVAVAPSRSADGHTRLLVNSHQPFVGQFSWWEAVVQSGEGWHVAGGFFPGSPFLLAGHNAHLGWGPTVNRPDLADVYALTINPENPNQYKLDGVWRDLERREVAIPVKQADGSMATVRRELLRSAHGPAVRTERGVFAVRYAAMDQVRQPLQYLAMNKARSAEEWRAAMALQGLPSINYIYADKTGTIGFVHNGLYPVRKEGVDWKGVVPGDRSDLIWAESLPFSGVPQVWNPKSGWLFNANNTPFQSTDPADDLKPADFSPTLGLQTAMTNRGWRALETYGADSSITAAEFEAYKYDDAYSTRSEANLAKTLIGMADAGGDAELAAALTVAKGWDLRTNVENRATALVVLAALRLRQGGIAPTDALKQAAGGLKARFGRIDPTWGEVNRIRRGTVDLPVDGGPDIFRAIYGRPDPDGRLAAWNGDGFYMFVEWDKAGRVSSRSIHQFGAATLDASSPHYADQTPLFAAKKTKPVLFTEAQLKGEVERDYRPGERGGARAEGVGRVR